MKKINFFRSAKALTIALMASMAMVSVSCTKDELPVTPPDSKPDTDQTVRFDANVKVGASMSYQKCHAVDELIKLYQGKVGSTGTVSYIMVDGEVNMQFKTTKDNQSAFKQAVRNVSASELDEVLMGTDASSVEISVSYGNEAIVRYTYTEKAVEGTWKGTSGGVDYVFELTAAKTAKGYYVATFTIDGQKVAGTAYKNGKQYVFVSDEKYAGGLELYAASVSYSDSSMNQVRVTLMKNPVSYLLKDIVFTK